MRIGEKYYRYTDGICEIVRVYKINQKRIDDSNISRGTIFYYKEDGNRYKSNLDDFQSNFIKLNPHGLLTVSFVELDQYTKDVIITLHTEEEIANNDSIPYCVCRQFMTNIFYDYYQDSIKKPDSEDPPVCLGVSISKDTCPEDIDYNVMVSCNKILDTCSIAVYIDDNKDELLKFINLKTPIDMYLGARHKAMENETKIIGIQKSISDLMDFTEFMYDFNMAFSIYPLEFQMEYNEDTGRPREDIRLTFQNYFNEYMESVVIIPYNYNINRHKIIQDVKYVRDNTGQIFIVCYDSNGYINKDMAARIKSGAMKL